MHATVQETCLNLLTSKWETKTDGAKDDKIMKNHENGLKRQFSKQLNGKQKSTRERSE